MERAKLDKRLVSEVVVEHYCKRSGPYKPLKQEVEEVLPQGWTFVSNEITEQDSFGPVASKVTVRSMSGTKLSWLI